LEASSYRISQWFLLIVFARFPAKFDKSKSTFDFFLPIISVFFFIRLSTCPTSSVKKAMEPSLTPDFACESAGVNELTLPLEVAVGVKLEVALVSVGTDATADIPVVVGLVGVAVVATTATGTAVV